MNVIDWLQAPAFTSFGAPTSRIELIGFITGAVCVYLVARQNVWNWPIGITNNIAFIAVFLTAGLYADTGLQVVYIALGVWGWYRWTVGRESTPHAVTGTSPREWVWLLSAGLLATGLMFYILTVATESTVPFWDAVTTSLSLMATWGQAKKRWESWVLWIIADVIYVPLYLYKGLTLTALLYLGFIVLCVMGLREWRRDMTSAAIGPAVLAATAR